MNRFIALFLLILISLFTLEMQTAVQSSVVEPFTASLARVSAALITPFDESVLAYGKVLQFGPGGFAVSIEAGCNGVEATIILVAAILAFPAPWQRDLRRSKATKSSTQPWTLRFRASLMRRLPDPISSML